MTNQVKVHCGFDAMVDPRALKQHPKNPNTHTPEQIKRLGEIIDYQGWRYPIKVSNLSGCVSSGNGRVQAAILRGWEEVPVNYQDYEDEAQEYADLVADNAIAAWAKLELSVINEDIGEYGPDLDVDMLGLLDFEVEPADKYTDGEDDVPSNVAATAKLGDLWLLGEHRLLCGDCTDKANVDRLMDGEKADMVFTDPPYGINRSIKKNYASKKRGTRAEEWEPIAGDDSKFDFSFAHKIMDAPVWCVWGGNYFCDTIPTYFDGNYVVWAKAHSDTENAVFGSSFELMWSWPYHKQQIWYVRRINMGKEEHGMHPTQKPIELAVRAFEYHSIPAPAVVFDFFLGSGSTLIACEKTNRKCYGLEINPVYCDVIVKRWEDFTGKKAELQT